MKISLGGALVLASVISAAGLTVVPSASAAASNYPGSSGYLNMWEDDNYQGCYQSRVSYDAKLYNDDCGWGKSFGDVLSSFVNKTNDWWILYEDSDFNGARVCVRPNSHDPNIGDNTSLEDDISSVERLGTSKPAGCTYTVGLSNNY